MINFKIKIALTALIGFWLLSLSAQAARIILEPANVTANVGNSFTVKIYLDTEGASINALDVGLLYPKLIAATKVSKTGSILTLWLQDPSFTGDAVLLRGGTPGGIITSRGLLATVTFQAKAVGNGSLGFTPATQALLNDGAGTAANLTAGTFSVTVTPKDKITQKQDEAPTPSSQPEAKKDDTNKPKAFTLSIDHDTRVFNDAYFVAFYTTDHESGVDHYEIKEGKGVFKYARSPYLLTDQNRRSVITVRAYDSAGNYRQTTYPDLFKRLWWKLLNLFGG